MAAPGSGRDHIGATALLRVEVKHNLLSEFHASRADRVGLWVVSRADGIGLGSSEGVVRTPHPTGHVDLEILWAASRQSSGGRLVLLLPEPAGIVPVGLPGSPASEIKVRLNDHASSWTQHFPGVAQQPFTGSRHSGVGRRPVIPFVATSGGSLVIFGVKPPQYRFEINLPFEHIPRHGLGLVLSLWRRLVLLKGPFSVNMIPILSGRLGRHSSRYRVTVIAGLQALTPAVVSVFRVGAGPPTSGLFPGNGEPQFPGHFLPGVSLRELIGAVFAVHGAAGTGGGVDADNGPLGCGDGGPVLTYGMVLLRGRFAHREQTQVGFNVIEIGHLY